jgi:hypothetical protein
LVFGLFLVWFVFGLVCFGLVGWLVTCIFHVELFTTHKFLSPLYVFSEH